MTDDLAATSLFPENLDRQSVLTAVSGLCGVNHSAATLLRPIFKRLTTHTGSWAAQARRLSFLKIAAHHAAAPLREVLRLPGDLALLQRSEGSFMLLHFHEQRWRRIGADGLPLADVIDVDSEVYVEAVVLRMPLIHWKLEGLASLAVIWPELRAAWAEVGLASFFINGGQLLLPLFAMLVYDKVANNGLFETLWTLTFGMALYVATDMGMRFVRSWATERVGVDLTLRSDEGVWRKLLAQIELPPGGFARFLSNYRDLSLSRDFVSSSYLLALVDIPFLLLYLLVIGIIAWPLLLVAVLLVLIYAGTGLIQQFRVNSLTQKAEQENTRKLMFMGDVLGALDVARTTPGAGFFLRHWRELVGKSAHTDAGRRLAASHQGMLAIAMQTVSTVVILVVGVYLIDARQLSIGKLIACNLLTSRAMGLVASLFAVMGKWQDFKRAAARMEGSLKMPAERELTPRPDTTGHIAVIGLDKKYEGRPPALENVSFTVTPGERLALLGRPGAGKTTLLRALAGLCAPDGGQILIDGLALEDIASSDRMRWLAYKSQEPVVFAGTLENNLGVAGCHDTRRFAEALWVTGLDKEFTSGRMSLGMQLEERGNNLSGGQRQKVALARALAQPSRILLLDEPTLGLDPESEQVLAERLPSFLAPESVLLMTTHSAIMLNIVQRIIALDGGRVVADGAREKLVRIK